MLDQQIIARRLGVGNNDKGGGAEKKLTSPAIIFEQQYFDKAKEWYVAKYLCEFRNLLYIAVIFIISVYSAYNVYRIAAAYYTIPMVPFAIYFDDDVDNFARIKPISGDKRETISVSLARYMLAEYVVLRESYSRDLLDLANWEALLSKVRSLSSRRVFSDFIHFMNTQENPDSPILKYRFSKKRTITIRNVDFGQLAEHSVPDSATVDFDAVVSSDNGMVQSDRMKVMVEFDINDIHIRKKDMKHYSGDPLYFMVTKYTMLD